MIYVLARHGDYDFGEVIQVSESLQTCVDAINKHPSFPYVGDRIEVTVWENDKKIAVSKIKGHREEWDDGDRDPKEIPVTFEEIMSNMVKVNE
ncbi:hypothetical protein Lw1_gp119 [Escherichia phage Lw1]|uniref:Uncharacterized protein n=1 Tax=Escherichia phage Lw1 TaxID=1307804 RepID=M9UV63_9CAUD|nr:hypothetical protein Lw1_gp119 [Escherichia phage Lw1]AGJ71527.1 hypothetical protein Lw1_gp119 [Escherichia phage Lw1]